MKINLEKIILKNLREEIVGEVNGREAIANNLYTQGGKDNLMCMDLAKKMYNGDEDLEYTRNELAIIRETVYKNFVPMMIDAVIPIINKAESNG